MLQPVFHVPVPNPPSEVVVRNVPPYLMRRLRERALANHRTLQDELYAILEQALMHDEEC